MSQDTINAVENDRRAVAKRIHDSIGGSLSAIKLFMECRMDSTNASPSENTKPVEQIISYLVDIIKETKRI